MFLMTTQTPMQLLLRRTQTGATPAFSCSAAALASIGVEKEDRM